MRLDADDYLHESALLVLVDAIQESRYSSCLSDYYYVDKMVTLLDKKDV